MRYWVLAYDRDYCYILDEEYTVFRFSIREVHLIAIFLPIVGVYNRHLSCAVITCWAGWARDYVYLGAQQGRDLNAFVDLLRSEGYLIEPQFSIYSPNIVLSTGICCLVSEFGELLRMDLESDSIIRLDKFTTSIRGTVNGSDFTLILSKKVLVANPYFMERANGINKIIIESDGDTKYYNHMHSMLRNMSTNMPLLIERGS